MTARKLIFSSVVRGSRQGDSHGGLYIIDLDAAQIRQAVDWNNSNIDWEGRGADRGLRGIAIDGERIFVAASDELFVYNPRFEIVASYRNKYLKHCHEIWLHRGLLFMTSTGFDSLLIFDPGSGEFVAGMTFLRDPAGFRASAFDPNGPEGPFPINDFHFNNIYVDDDAIFLAGRKLPALLRIADNKVSPAVKLPLGTHNARPFNGGFIFNDTEQDKVCVVTPTEVIALDVPRFKDSTLLNTDFDESGLARQAFGRGLCPLSDRIIAAGSSPSTISLYDLEKRDRIKSINVSMDVRNAVHGIAIWPF